MVVVCKLECMGNCLLQRKKKIMLTRVSPQASGKGRKSDSLGASFQPLRQRRYNPAVRVSRQWTHTAHTNAHTSARVKHTQPPLPMPKKNEAWSVGPWLLAPRLRSQGPVSKEFFRPQAPR